MYAFIRWWATIFLRLYFRKTIIYGLDQVPEKGPLIVASNHPSAFMEASILSTVIKRPVHFLVRGDMFHPRFRWLFDWTKQIPIYRQKDGMSNLRKNASSFDLTYKKLGEGAAVLIFPEAKTVLEKKLRPIQRGTAHLAFGTMPFLQPSDQLMIQPVGVNFTEPRIPGTDVVVRFGKPFIASNASREDRDAIEQFTIELSEAMDGLVIQVGDNVKELNYDLVASIYFRMVYDNQPGADAFIGLKKIEETINNFKSDDTINVQIVEATRELGQMNIIKAVYFPELLVLNRMGLLMMSLLKTGWIISGGWLWLLVRNTVFAKIKTNTFQGPTTLGAFMVVMPLATIILAIVLLIADISLIYLLLWLLVMWMGTLIRAPLNLIIKILLIPALKKKFLKHKILLIRKHTEKIVI